jgi:glycosyltransferase involved in cell wall biosynthesis
VIVNLLQGLAERAIPTDLVLAAAEGVFLEQLPPAVRLVDLRARRLMRSLVPLTEYLRRERPRYLVSSMSHANLIALWAARLARRSTPVMVTVHNTMSQSTPNQGRLAGRLSSRLLRTFYPWARSVVAVSRGAADDLARTSGLPRERVEVVYNPVITPAMLAQARQAPDHPWFGAGQPPVILGVGRLTRQKDFPTLIRAFAEVRRRRPARLIILGEGEERTGLEALVGSLAMDHEVALPGFRDSAMAYMAQSALFVLSSAWEGLPTVLIEALAAGTRVVSTDCPSGPREILQDGRLGALVPVGDPAALAAALMDTLDQPVRAVTLDDVRPFTRDAAVEHYLQLIESGE